MRRIAAGVGVLLLVFVASELVLPRIATNRLRDDLAKTADVRSVKIEAFPALKLLFHRADRVEVRLGDMRTGTPRRPSPTGSRRPPPPPTSTPAQPRCTSAR